MPSKGRGNGEGSIVQRKDGLWEAKVSVGYRTDAEGNAKRVRKSVYGKTRREVADKLKTELTNQQQGLPVAIRRQTVAQFLKVWLEETAKPNVRPRTYDSYAMIVNRHLIPTLGHHKLTDLEPQHVQKMMNQKIRKAIEGEEKPDGLSPRSVQYLRAVLRRALNQALREGGIHRNVATLVDPPKSTEHEITVLSREQAAHFLRSVQGDRLEALYSVALTMGLRQGEALALRWSDIDFEGRTLSVAKSLQRIGGELVLTEPKTRKSRRRLAIPDPMVRSLRDHKRRQTEERLAAPSWTDWQGEGLVFTTPRGTPVDVANLTKRFKAHLEGAGLPVMRWHDLRHSCATLMLARNIGPRTIMETLGHSQISLTMNTYAHVMPETMRDAADSMGDLFPEPTPLSAVV